MYFCPMPHQTHQRGSGRIRVPKGEQMNLEVAAARTVFAFSSTCARTGKKRNH